MAMDSLELHELNEKSAGIGAWVLQVHAMRHIEYEYQWQGKAKKGEKLECLLLAADASYCQGVIKVLPRRAGGGDPGADLRKMMEKFCNGTVWKMTKVTLANEKKEFIGAPYKVCVDIRSTKSSPVLQSQVQMPPAPAPEEDLKSIVTLPSLQRVDLTALISSIGTVRRETTAYGRKDIVDITVVDGSMQKDEKEQVSAKIALFFDANATGSALLQSMQDATAAKKPVALYGLTCLPQGERKCELKTGQTFFWEPAQGTYAKLLRLQNQADELLGASSTTITTESVPTSSARDFAAEDATYSVCGWIAAVLRPPSGMQQEAGEPEGTDKVFQINHCHVAVPGAGQQLLTNNGSRIWLQNLRIMDATGSFNVSVREKAALALSGCNSQETFVNAHATDNLSFPVLASVRVHLAKRKDVSDGHRQEGGAAEPTLLTAVLVEAEDQDLHLMPTKALLELRPILKCLAASTEELKITRLRDIGVLPHVGMVVDGQKCELALVLAGATEKSEFKKFGDGYRLITKNMLDVGFGVTAVKPEDCRGGTKTDCDLVAICTEHNLTEYKMAPPRKGGVQFALVAISSVRETPATGAGEPGRKSLMVERIQLIDTADVEACQKMLGKLSHARSEFSFEGNKRDRSAWDDQSVTPGSSAKKVRRLSAAPSDGSLPDGA